jgi:hypothetical protein
MGGNSAGDLVETVGLNDLLRGNVDAQIKLRVTKPNGDIVEVEVEHTVSADQVKNWILSTFCDPVLTTLLWNLSRFAGLSPARP